MCLDLNQNSSIPPELRFDVAYPGRKTGSQMIVPANITPEAANEMLMRYKQAVHAAQIPPLDLHVVRAQIDQRLAEQDVIPLQVLQSATAQPVHLDDPKREVAPVGYLTSEQEAEYLLRLDAKTDDPLSVVVRANDSKHGDDDKLSGDLTLQEVERQNELLNPQSQHNWLKHHPKPGAIGAVDDNESLASHDTAKAAPKKRGGNKNLAKQVGDRAVERAREGFSPGAASGFEEDELTIADEHPGPVRKRGKDPDGTYRSKAGKGGKSKRKRSGEEVGGPSSASKKARVESVE